jgi:CBS domain-containing protein
MEIRECMSKELVTVNPTSSLEEAAKLLKKKNVGSILVVDTNMMLKGILTDRDIALAIGAEGKSPQTAVQEVMKKDPKNIEINDTLDHAFEMMGKHNIRRLPVVDKGKLVGIISSSDLAATLKKQIDHLMSLEEQYSKTI